MHKTNTPIFIVGAPRSGTTLLTAMLSAHSRIDAGPETQLFKNETDRLIRHAVADKNWPQKAVKLLQEIRLSKQSVCALFGLDSEQLKNYLAKRQPSVQAILEALTASHCCKNGKQRWIEKTPNHILYVEQIRRLYPDSPIIRIVRDPRDSAVSIGKLPWAPTSPVANAMLIEHWYMHSREFFEKDQHCYTIRYEDLIAEPVLCIKKLCDFLNEEFEQGMLNTEKSGQSIASANEPWKNMVSTGLTKDRCYVWKKNVAPVLVASISKAAEKTIGMFDYQQVPSMPIQKTLRLISYRKPVFDFDDQWLATELFKSTKVISPESIEVSEQWLLPPLSWKETLKTAPKLAKLALTGQFPLRIKKTNGDYHLI